jgi:hypothetical protein
MKDWVLGTKQPEFSKTRKKDREKRLPDAYNVFMARGIAKGFTMISS